MDMDTPWLARDKEFTVKYREWAVIGHHNIPVHYVKGVEWSVNR